MFTTADEHIKRVRKIIALKYHRMVKVESVVIGEIVSVQSF